MSSGSAPVPKDFNEWMRRMERNIRMLMNRSGGGGAALPDTGWVTVTPINGFTQYITLRVRRIGDQVFLDGGVRSTGDLENVFASLDAQFRPSSLQVRTGWYAPPSASGAVMGMVIETSGACSVEVPVTNAWYMTGFTYLAT